MLRRSLLVAAVWRIAVAQTCEKVGDGICHREFNTRECDYDGGDCLRAAR